MDAATFCEYISDPCERYRSRVLTGVSALDETTIRAAYGGDFERVRVGDFVTGERFIIMPPALFQELEEVFDAIRERGHIPIISGLDAYFGLLDQANRKSAFGFLLRHVNKTGRETVVAVLRWAWPEMRAVFTNPSLAGNDWIEISASQPLLPNVSFVPNRFVSRFPECNIPSLREWLNWRTDGGVGNEKAIVAVKFNAGDFPGLDNSHVRQVPDARTFLGAFCGIEVDRLDDAECDWVLANTETRNVAEELVRRFFPTGMDGLEKRILSRWSRIADATEKAVFLDVVASHAVPDGYLFRVLARAEEMPDDFTAIYLHPSEDDLMAPNASVLAKERENAVREVGAGMKIAVEAAQEAFLRDAADMADELIAPWMGLDLACEDREWIRRHLSGSLVAVERCRWLRAYLSEIGMGNAAVDGYFRMYRELKASNRIDLGFCETATTAEFPGSELDDRDAVVKSAAADESVFLLVVDGLGAEWLPFLATLANEHNIQITTAKCVKVLLPTSTEFNPTLEVWGDGSRYRKFDDLDKVYHKQGLSPVEGLSMEFAEAEDVLKQVRQLLSDWERVVVTADHGASRLAALAYEQGLTTTLKPGKDGVPSGIEPEKWRFAKIPNGSVVGCEVLESSLSGEWACVKGYARFSISGGATFELHGGATLEERLVPWIVFERGFSTPFRREEAKLMAAPSSDDGQIVVDPNFDI